LCILVAELLELGLERVVVADVVADVIADVVADVVADVAAIVAVVAIAIELEVLALTKVPTPQGIASPLGWVEFAGSVLSPEGEAIVKRVVHVEFAVSSPLVN